MRYFLDISFNGKQYHGWQIQPDAITVQEVIERSLSTLLRKEIKVTAAGRTDTGVHARQMIVHFDCDSVENTEDLLFRMNSFLPKDIAVNALNKVSDEAHARFDAISRTYHYQLKLGKDPFFQDTAFTVHHKPDIELMNVAANELLGHQDFQCFSRSNTDVKTYYCDVKVARWQSTKDLVIFEITADRFLRNMVRAIVGTLLEVGYKKTSLETFKSIIKSKDRSKAGASAPAHGLFLTSVKYPETLYS